MRCQFLQCGLLLLFASIARAQPTALTVNTSSREEVRQFYRAIYNASEGVPINWTGSYVTGNAGDTSAAFKEATRLRINFFRALAGVPAGITLNSTYNAKNQEAALMQSVNAFSNNVITLNHVPPSTWMFYTAGGFEAAGKSNLYYGKVGANAMTGYMADAGPINSGIGHRRWLLFPQTLQTGTGDVPGDGTLARGPANAQWILDTTPGGTTTSPRPATRTTQVPYPPAGFVPYQIVFPRWSFSYPGADFSATSVTMTRAGQSIPVALEPLNNATTVGEPTIAWVYNNTDSNGELPHPRPAADTTYAVNVNNVRIAGAAQNFSYSVTVFDPDIAAADSAPLMVAGSGTPALGTATPYTIITPSFLRGFDWRTLQSSPFAKTFTAEAGLDGLVAGTSAGYTVVQTITAGAGTSSYRLGHSSATSQILTVPGTFLASASSSVAFLSRLGIATSSQTARVQVSTDDGESWLELFAQAGTSAANSTSPNPTDSAFVLRSVSLAAYAGRTVNVRLAFTILEGGGGYLPGPNNLVGWFIDDLTLNGVQTVTTGASTRTAVGGTFSFTPAAAGPIAVQARGVLFGIYPIEWGPVTQLTVIDNSVNNNPGRLVNLSILTSLSATDNNFTMGYVVGGSNTSGAKPVLIRAAGPSLAQLGVTGSLDDPKLELFAGSTRTGENDNWGGTTELGAAMAGVGAFAYVSGDSRDSAVLANITTSNNSAVVTSANNGTGTVIAELYDSTPTPSFTAATPRLVNVSVLKHLGSGLTAGFVIGGSTSKTVLIRAIGPTIGAAPFNVGGAVADPQLTLFSGQIIIGSNDNWGGTPALTAAFGQVGAFVLPATSRDAALVATLEPGNYTVRVTGVGNTTGAALVEVYEVP